MKYKLITLVLFLTLTNSNIQSQVILLSENFEIADSVTSSGIPGWALTNTVHTSGFFSDSSGAANDTSVMTTIMFSTIGNYSIKLNFNHIVWGENNIGTVSASTDNGNTWTTLSSNEYQGKGQAFSSIGYFSSNDYNDWTATLACNTFEPFNNDRFKNETFDLSSICANSNSVLVRFQAISIGSNCGGWYIDDLKISGNPISINSTNSCNNNGTASVTPFFGSGPYSYSWSNGASTANLTNLSPGTYNITVTESGGSSVSDSVIISSAFNVIMSINNPSCPPVNNGLVTAIPLGTANPFTYLWSNGQNGQSATGLTQGVYTVSVTDALGCVVVESVSLVCGLGISIGTTPSSCTMANGTATVNSIVNGTPPYNYLWATNPIQTTQSATGLNGNTLVNVTITDALGSSSSNFIVIPFVDTINVNATITPSQCILPTGASTATASGGTAPYSFSWNTNPPQSSATANNLSAQGYQVTATDNNGCTSVFSVQIPNIGSLSAQISGSPTICGLSTGTATLFINGGTAPYSYIWNTSPAQTTANASNLPYGNHNVTITDNAGCAITQTIFIGSTNSMAINISFLNNSCVCVDPLVNVSGGTAPFTYLWDDGSSNQSAICFDEGWHYVLVTDAAGCSQIESFYVTFSANCYINLNGTVYNDNNKNCIKESGEYGISNAVVNLDKPGFSQSTLTDNNGNYSFYVLNDSYQLSHIPSSNWYANCPNTPSSFAINVPTGSINTFDFADTTNTLIDEVEIFNCFINGRTRGFNSINYVTIRNNGTNQLNGTVTTIHDPILSYANSNPIVSSYNSATRTASWNYTNLNPGETRIYRLTTLIPSTAALGTKITNSSSVTPLTSDILPANNSCSREAFINGSYDPNAKLAWPQNNIDVSNEWHTYFIQFQNTGTASAARVIIEDTLDANLDFTSITDIIGSHPYTIDDSQLPLIRFIFDNINLPDSNFNEAESHGFIGFRIKRNVGVPIGTQITNTAFIYFDFNNAIVTNTVTNTVVYVGINEHEILSTVSVYPNPSSGSVTIDYKLKGNEKSVLQLFNPLNQLIHSVNLSHSIGKLTIDLSKYSAGIYSYRIISKYDLLNSGKINLMK